MKKLIYLLCFLPVAAFSQNLEAYDCDITQKGPDGWMGDVVLVSFAGDQVGIYDVAIHEVHEHPITVKLRQKTERQYSFRWSVKGIKTSNEGSTTVSYSARFNRVSRTISINGNLHGSDNVIYGKGKCRALEN